MLHEDGGSPEVGVGPPAVRDPVEGEDVAVLGGGPVLLHRVAVLPDQVGLDRRDSERVRPVSASPWGRHS